MAPANKLIAAPERRHMKYDNLLLDSQREKHWSYCDGFPDRARQMGLVFSGFRDEGVLNDFTSGRSRGHRYPVFTVANSVQVLRFKRKELGLK
ncbi:hypothetical protein chiPu_0001221 [Chiloscyllium punctatum]|uniref:Uncharacterized protein n=1 Tax=Chiloscyllium punctatum TaxID=137246 RepID=A0A401RXF0_CHIPU|nr:hypothetical protein [Chiloscyllium punctatum]